MKLYGLKNCDTCRKAMKQLDAAGVNYDFLDVRDDSVSKRQVMDWAKAVGWEKLLNRASTTWRQLPADEKDNVDHSQAVRLMADHPTLIKRPVVQLGGDVFIGWKKETQDALLK
ncbi:MAG: Spx/MgsR family RNA polymerase-binding regulatory protein [Marinicaulis sp.]|nr:Spx/MgsR family RNA polymerase-binding regulatory protein [Marinicaulis sp.]